MICNRAEPILITAHSFSMIQTNGLCKYFGDLKAVDDLNLDIAGGEFFAFLGPNAAGKTTTIKMLTGLLKPTKGNCRIGGFDIQTESIKAKEQISYVPDFPFLYEKLTPREFLNFTGNLFDMESRRIETGTMELFEKFNLHGYASEPLEHLSHGTRQRVAIASALLHDPRVIIIDEPMVGLDPVHARIIKDELKSRSRAGCTIFLSTHTLSVAEEMADRIGIIHQGRLIALGTVEALREKARNSGALEKVFLALIDAEDKHREDLTGVSGLLASVAGDEGVSKGNGGV